MGILLRGAAAIRRSIPEDWLDNAILMGKFPLDCRVMGIWTVETRSRQTGSRTIPLAKSAQICGAGFRPEESAQFCAIPHAILRSSGQRRVSRGRSQAQIATDLRWPFSCPVGVFGLAAQQKPSARRWSSQPTGSSEQRSKARAVSSTGWRPSRIAAVTSGARKRSRARRTRWLRSTGFSERGPVTS